MKSPWFTPRSRSDLSANSRCISSATTPTNRTDRCRTGAGWRGTNCAPPEDADTADARRSLAAAIPTAVEVERLFAWLQNFRRILVHYERFAGNFLGMLHLACCLILLRCL